MKSFDDISIGILVLLVFILAIEIYYIMEHENNNVNIMMNDTYVSKRELHEILEKKGKTPPTKNGLIKCATTGAIRGVIMGMLLYGAEGALTGGIVFAIVNPLISGVEHLL